MTSTVEDRPLKITSVSWLILTNKIYRTQAKNEVEKLLSKVTLQILYLTYTNQPSTATRENKNLALTLYNIVLQRKIETGPDMTNFHPLR